MSKAIQKDITMAQTPPSVVLSPENAQVVPGPPAAFTAAATGVGELSFRWERIPPGSAVAQELADQKGPSLTVTPVTLAESGTQFRCRVVTTNGEAISQPATLTVVEDRG
jgi:hypothetical protein